MNNSITMKTIYIFAIAILTAVSAVAQENQNEYRSIFNKKSDQKTAHGGYGGFGIGYGVIDDKDALLFHFKSAWVIDHKIGLGFAGSGFFNNIDKRYGDTESYLAGGYGGFLVEPVLFSNLPVHVAFPVILGAGGVSTVPQSYINWDPINTYQYDYDVFFFVEPGVEVELNMVKFFRMTLGVSYRITNGIILTHPDYDEVPIDALDGLSFNMNFKFGKF